MNAIAQLSKTTKRAVKKYTEEKCLRAFRMNRFEGEGANTVGIYLGLTTRQADAAINAGCELNGDVK